MLSVARVGDMLAMDFPAMPPNPAEPPPGLLPALGGKPVHAAGTFALDRWQGEERVQFKLVDIALAEPFPGR